jgi:hypothetical protein
MAATARLTHDARPVSEADLQLSDGRALHVYYTGADDDVRLTVFWHHWHAEHRRASRAPVPDIGPARHPLGFVRPSGVRRISVVPWT